MSAVYQFLILIPCKHAGQRRSVRPPFCLVYRVFRPAIVRLSCGNDKFRNIISCHIQKSVVRCILQNPVLFVAVVIKRLKAVTYRLNIIYYLIKAVCICDFPIICLPGILRFFLYGLFFNVFIDLFFNDIFLFIVRINDLF